MSPDVYRQAPLIQEEHEELVRSKRQLPVREWLLRRAALADRGSLAVSSVDEKQLQDLVLAAPKLARYDREHQAAAGPFYLSEVTFDSPADELRAYVRQEYTAWSAAR
ncbi:hypothetical protein [Streptomyces sp. NPDC048248]|uniref:hypothetical protein n=1 Tax=Streptomyces sp. NPDC048248 TaxID=3365523 RepID=UPI00371712EC